VLPDTAERDRVADRAADAGAEPVAVADGMSSTTRAERARAHRDSRRLDLRQRDIITPPAPATFKKAFPPGRTHVDVRRGPIGLDREAGSFFRGRRVHLPGLAIAELHSSALTAQQSYGPS
jgi:hypothetical protein